MADFYQKVGKRKYLDYEKIRNLGYPINFLLSERFFQGKTFNALEHILDNWRKKGWRAVWMFNSVDQLFEAKKGILNNSRIKNPEKWKNVYVNSNGLYDGKEHFCYFGTMRQVYQMKSTRDFSVKTIIYDEFNEGTFHLGVRQHEYWEMLINTFVELDNPDPQFAAFLLANVKSLGNILLSKYGISSFEKELTTRSMFGQKLLLVYVPKNQMDNIAQASNWTLVNSHLLGLDRESFFAENTKDNMTNIIRPDHHHEYKIYKKVKIAIQETFLLVWQNDKHQYFFEETKGDMHTDIKTCTTQLQEIDTTFTYLPELKKELLIAFEEGKLFFANFYCKKLLKDAIWKH